MNFLPGIVYLINGPNDIILRRWRVLVKSVKKKQQAQKKECWFFQEDWRIFIIPFAISWKIPFLRSNSSSYTISIIHLNFCSLLCILCDILQAFLVLLHGFWSGESNLRNIRFPCVWRNLNQTHAILTFCSFSHETAAAAAAVTITAITLSWINNGHPLYYATVRSIFALVWWKQTCVGAFNKTINWKR